MISENPSLLYRKLTRYNIGYFLDNYVDISNVRFCQTKISLSDNYVHLVR